MLIKWPARRRAGTSLTDSYVPQPAMSGLPDNAPLLSEHDAAFVAATAHAASSSASSASSVHATAPAADPPAGSRRRAARRLAWLLNSRCAFAVLVIAMICAWLLPGTLGHDPWKQDETYTFGIIQHMLRTGDWIVPTNAGQPFVEKPPLYDWVAAGLAWMFGRYLTLHDAARLASALFGALTLYCTARIVRRATAATRWSDARVVTALALFASTLVVIKHVHDMMTDVGLMAGAALGFYGLYELVLAAVRRTDDPDAAHADTSTAALCFGAGVGIALMTKGLFVPLVFGATTFGAMVLYPACRSRAFLRSLGIAMLALAPLALIWPICFYLRSEALFKVWFWDNNVGRFFGFSVPELGSENDGHLFIVRAALSLGFPVVPLAVVALCARLFAAPKLSEGIARLFDPRVLLPAMFALIGFAVLQVSATVRVLYILPFIPPLAALAVEGVARLPRRLSLAWDMFSRVLFGSVVVLAWIVWSIMTDPASTHASLHRLGRWLPLDWTLPVRPALVAAALALTFGALWSMPMLKHTGRWRGALSWCLGAIVAWGLVSTLLLPWLDYAKSYRSVFEGLNTKLATEWTNGDCMASIGLGESEAPMLEYFSGVEHQPVANANATDCTWLIVESRRSNATLPPGHWKPFWSGARPGDDDELLRVFVRTPQATIAR